GNPTGTRWRAAIHHLSTRVPRGRTPRAVRGLLRLRGHHVLRRSPGRKACRHVVPRACITLVMLLPATTALAQAPFTAVASPAPVVLQAGGATVNVTVTTTVMTDFRDLISYSFSGFPAEIATGGPRIVQPPFAPETF